MIFGYIRFQGKLSCTMKNLSRTEKPWNIEVRVPRRPQNWEQWLS